MNKIVVKVGAALVAGLLLSFSWVDPSSAALTVESLSGFNLIVDSNVTAPSTYAPSAAYIGARICNTDPVNALSNVVAYVGNYNGGVGSTPGVFPVTTFGTDITRPHLSGTGGYSFTLESGSTGAADGTRYVGTLAANTCRVEYWLFSYPQCVNVGGAQQYPPCDVSIAGSVGPEDDVSLGYDLWATASPGPLTSVLAPRRTFTMRNEISAAANKIWPNTTAKVPDEYLSAIQSVVGWGTLGPDGQPLTATNAVYPGQRVITTQGIWYDLGNVGHGFDNNGDLVPDQNAWLQPVGDAGMFDGGCFRMVNVYGIVIVKLKTGGELLIPFRNQLYYQNLPDNTGVVGLVYYQYIATSTGCSAMMSPYQEAASGYDNEKFSADYGLTLSLLSGSFNPASQLTFVKSDGVAAVAPGGVLTYTVTANNFGSGVNLGAPDLGAPITFHESIPSGSRFSGFSADDIPATNLTEPAGTGSYSQRFTDADGNIDTCTINYRIPASASYYAIRYSTDSGSTWRNSRSIVVGTTATNTAVTSGSLFTSADVGATVSGFGIPNGATITVVTDASNATISTAATLTGTPTVTIEPAPPVRSFSVTTNGTTTVTSAALFLASDVGSSISGVGIAVGATITAFATTSSVTISAAAAAGTPTATIKRPPLFRAFNVGTTTGGTNVTSAGLFLASDVGSLIEAAGIPSGTTITAFITTSSVTISAQATANATTLAVVTTPITDIEWMLMTTIALDGYHNGTACVAPDTAYDNGTLETSLPAGKSATVAFTTRVKSNPGPVLCNSAYLQVGPASSDVVAEDCDLVTGNNSLAGVVFRDDGVATGTIYGNYVKEANEGVIGSRSFSATTNGTTTVTSVGLFTAGDVGYAISGTGIPAGATITAFTDTNTVIISAAATTSGATTVFLGGRGVSVSTTNTSTTVTSAGLFVAGDVGSRITGTGIPAGATITAFTNASTVTISAAATATGTPTVSIGGAIVKLYYDRNGDGLYDSGDILYGITSTDGTGAYSFTSLPDGPFLVVVKKYDGTTSDGVNNAATDAGFGTTGWGNTTFDPNLPLTTDQGVLKLNEDLTTATLAVNIDLNGDNPAAQILTGPTGVNFSFAPPLQLTKTVPSPSVDEGDVFSYTINLKNRLPAAGKQGPTGCQYTVWAPAGVNGTSSGFKDFTNPGNAWDGPNRTVATGTVIGGGNREIDGRNFSIADQAGSITKVEALFFGYYNLPLLDDYLSVKVTLGASTLTGSIPTTQLDSYLGEPAGLDPDSAISWDITALRPPASSGPWTWADDFSTVILWLNPKKTAGADGKVFAVDGIGLRITTDADCVAGSTTTLSPVPLQDRFDTTSFTFVSADPPPTSVSGGTIKWDDVGPILPGSSKSVTVTVRAKDVTGTTTGTCAATSAPSNPPPGGSACNLAETAYDGKNVYYADGRKANDADAKVPVNIVGKAELRGTVWSDVNQDGWPNNDGEPGLPNVVVTLFTCVWADGVTMETGNPNSTCVGTSHSGNADIWIKLATTRTDASGNYEFIGLDNGTYIVEVGDTDNAPAGTNTAPYNGTQKAEPNDAQTVTAGNADGTAGVCLGAGGCNNTWGNPANNLSAHNQLNLAEETINGINFGYYISTATLYGNVWHDIDGDAAVDGGETGLSGFTVQLYSDPNGDGNKTDGALQAFTNSDASGNYFFSNLAAASYVIVVTPPTLLTESWAETAETSVRTVVSGTTNGSTTVTSSSLFLPSDVGRSISGAGIPAGATITAFGSTSSVTISSAATADGSPTLTVSEKSLDNQIPVTLATGQFSGSHDFGYTKASTSDIGDTVYFDFNANGVQDVTEVGIPNITVWLYIDVDRDGTIDDGVDNLVGTDVTDTSGKYLFVDLTVGSYVVKVDTTDPDFPTNVTVTGDPDVNTARIGDRIYYDANGDGLAGTPRTFTCTATSGSQTVTSASLFLASDVGAMITGPGIPIGAIITTYNNASSVTISANATAAAGTNPLNLRIDDGIAGVVVHLYSNTDGDNTIDPGEPLVASTVTDVNGNYLLAGLSAGNYLVEVDTTTLPNSLLVRTSAAFTNIALADNGSSVLTADVGYSPTSNYALGNRVWLDADGDNVQDPGEMGIAGVRITVTNVSGTGCAAPGCTVTTDAGGFWFVPGLTNGTYTVDVNPGGTANKLASPRDFVLTSGTEAVTATINNADNMGVDFGYRYQINGTVADRDDGDPTGTIDGRVFVDVNADSMYGRSFTGTTTNGGTTVTTATPQFTVADVGRRIEGANIPVGTTITAFTSATNVTISNSVTTGTTGSVTVSADTPRNGSTVNLIDENGYVIATTTSDANGKYYFGRTATCAYDPATPDSGCSGIIIGKYTVQAVDSLGTFYSVLFLNAAQNISNLDVIYNAAVENTADSQSAVSVDGVHDNLLQDFGYQRFEGSIGDTVYHDVNENATQDLGETGFSGVTVQLYKAWWIDTNGNGFPESGESGGEVLVTTTTTTADDPLTAADESGKYLFSNLTAPTAARTFQVTTDNTTTVASAGKFLAADVGRPITGAGIPNGATITAFIDANTVTISAAAAAGTPTATLTAQYYLVRVDTTTIAGATKTLIADPDTDGVPCTLLPNPDVASDGYPAPGVCDNQQFARGFSDGVNYLGADFGYQVTGTGFASFGDTIWVDTNGNGIKDSGEVGIQGVTVWLDSDNDGAHDWVDTNGNEKCDLRTVAVTTNSSTTVSSAGLFTATDVNREISGPGIPSGATITVFTSASQVTISAATTTTASITATVNERECWVETDSDGYYTFSNLADGTYNVKVLVSRTVSSNFAGGATTITSASLFLPGDVGSTITGTNIPAGTVVTSYIDASTVTISQATTGAGPQTLTLKDFPSALSTIPTFEVRSGNTSLNNAIQVVVAAGVVTSIVDGDAGTTDACMRSAIVTSGSATVTSAAAQFLAGDVGALITGTGIPAGATITAFTSASQVMISVNATVTGATVLSLNGCDNLDVDFGYRYAGTYSLSGTICSETGPLDGYCGNTATTYTGVGTGEAALGGVQVGVYLWNDADTDSLAWNAGTGALDAGDTFTFLGSTTTSAAGDYSFSNLPAGKLVIVFGVSNTQNLRLTTDATGSSIEGAGPPTTQQLYDGTGTYLGNSVTVLVRQALTIAGNTIDVDFALDATLGGTILYDFGDLPASTPDYNATLLTDSGAQHRVTGASPYLGTAPSTEFDGKPSADAGLDPLASGDDKDDGVTPLSFSWVTGTTTNFSVVVGGAAGWLGGWIDFNQDGDFDDADETVIDRAVAVGTTSIPVSIPGLPNSGSYTFFSRFRLYPERPVFLASTGVALDASFATATGEVEDYRWVVSVTPAVISRFVAYSESGLVTVSWETSSEFGTVGFYLRRWDFAKGRYVEVNDKLLPSLHHAPQGGRYRFVDQEAFPGAMYDYEIVEVESNGKRTAHGPYTGVIVENTAPDQAGVDRRRQSARYSRARKVAPPSRSPGKSVIAADARISPVKAPAKPKVAVKSAKAGITESGVHYLGTAQLADIFGMSADTVQEMIKSDRFNLINRGEQVAVLPDSSGSGLFFYGEQLDSIYARDNVYWVEGRKRNELSMEQRFDTPDWAARGDETFTRTVHEEKDQYPEISIFTDVEGDYWLWDYFLGGWDTKTFPVRTDAIDPNSARVSLTVRFKGATDTEADPDHHAVLKLNGSTIADFRWNGLDAFEQTYDLDPALFSDGENSLEIAALGDTTAPYSFFYLDSYTVTYESYYRAQDDKLTFSAAGNSSVRISGFTVPDILLFDITDPKRPVFVPTAPDSAGEGEYGVNLAPRTPDSVYCALAADKVLPVSSFKADTPSSLTSREHKAQHVIVTTAEFKDAAQQLAQHRGALGSIVVDIEDVYDEFNHGIASPFALRDFLSFARRGWSKPVRYVVLAGDGTYDARDNQGLGGNPVPPKMVSTPFGFYPSDNWYAKISGPTSAPEIAVGRLPAANAAELTALIGKIIVREIASGADWTKRLYLVADNPDGGGDFTANSKAIGAMVPYGYQFESIHLADTTPTDARTRLLQGIGNGAGVINYVGHAGFDVLAEEGVLRSGDIGGLLNATKPTLLIAQTCIANYFAIPGYPSIGELLMSKQDGGAAAVWAPSGSSQDDLAGLLARYFYANYFKSGKMTIGDAVLEAAKAYVLTGNQPYLIDIYILLGDPAMPLH